MKKRSRHKSKQLGELGEVAFHLEALKQKLIVSKPSGDSSKYDFIVDSSGNLFKVQVKTTDTLITEGSQKYYKFTVAHGSAKKTSYEQEDVDFVICYALPENVWYVFPVDELNSVTVKTRPWEGTTKYAAEKFKGAWHLIK